MPSEVDVFSESSSVDSLVDLVYRPASTTSSQTTLSKLSISSAASICALRFSLYSVSFVMMTACYRWEFVSTLGFEWEVFTGKRPWKWSFVVYLMARFLAIITVLLNLVGANIHTRYDCNVSGHPGVPSMSVLTTRIFRRLGGVLSLHRLGSRRRSPHSFSLFGGKWSIVARVRSRGG